MNEGEGGVGVVVVGHGMTASQMLAAGQAIVGPGALDDVVAVDAGAGQTPELVAALARTIAEVDRGSGVLLMVDLLGASPCTCGLREGSGRRLALISGLNLAMLLKLASLDRSRLSPTELAAACADSALRAVSVRAAEEMR
jgi:PTS system mannose-specific IIA component